jgi:bacterioferritin
MLERASWMNIETVMSYIASSITPDGVRAQEVIRSLNDDLQDHGHATQPVRRITE